MNKSIKAYFSKKMLVTLLFGISSGLPLALVFGTLSFWLKDYGVAYKTIGAFSLIRLPYSFKWLWAPMVEVCNIPLLSKLGRRKSWAVFSQIGLLCSIICISFAKPDMNIMYMAAMAFLISFFSATQDIVLDAFRVEIFSKDKNEEVDGATIYVLGYRLGTIVSSAGAIGLASVVSWNIVYLMMAGLLFLGIMATLWADEPEAKNGNAGERKHWHYTFYKAVMLFLRNKYWLPSLLLVLVYRLSDAYFAPMAYPFYDDLGFSKLEIAYVSKIYGMIATIVGGLLGGYIVNKTGILKGLVLFAIVQGLTTALYIPLYYVGHNVLFLMLTITLENLSSGMATTVIIAFMSMMCNKGYTATQYALLSSLPGLARDVFASTSGQVLEMTSWPIFFTVSALLTMPAVMLSWYLYKKDSDFIKNLSFNKKML